MCNRTKWNNQNEKMTKPLVVYLYTIVSVERSTIIGNFIARDSTVINFLKKASSPVCCYKNYSRPIVDCIRCAASGENSNIPIVFFLVRWMRWLILCPAFFLFNNIQRHSVKDPAPVLLLGINHSSRTCRRIYFTRIVTHFKVPKVSWIKRHK